ncbi:hypothetical protein FRC08_005832 [Ceratobasidium sp. 394]|nr:hypothetical protein FRC08_005832 [Ceratobasidium sp. 394]
MALRNTASDNKQFRHRLQHIKLEPSTSAYDISIELLVDGKKIHKVQRIKKGQPLYWRELSLPCDVYETSTVTLRITEIRTVRDQVELAMYQITQTVSLYYSKYRREVHRAAYILERRSCRTSLPASFCKSRVSRKPTQRAKGRQPGWCCVQDTPRTWGYYGRVGPYCGC